MASNIDVTQPPEGNATTAAMRANMAAAKSEIEALQIAELSRPAPRVIGAAIMAQPFVTRASAADHDWRSIAWSAELGIFAAVGVSTTLNGVMTSPDGINWTLRSGPADYSWRGVAWSAELGLFAAVGITGVGDRVMTSPDGINWTLRTSAADISWIDIEWAEELGLFACVSSDAIGNLVMTSAT